MRLRAGAAPVVLGLALLSAPAFAQKNVEEAGQENVEEAGDAIIVTGSRIARPELVSPVPVAALGAEDLLRDGAVNIQDTLRELPQVGIGTTRTNSNFLTTGNGVATINLRNLGEDRTLVLVNGRRFVGGLAGTSIVDINNIPTDFIETVDVVTGGASAVYGSEAVAGVVNFILKDNFEGISARAQYGVTAKGDNPKYMASISAGTKFGADDRGSAMINFTYDKDTGLLSRKRSISSQDCGLLGCGPQSYSSYSAQGRFQLVGNGTADADTNILTDANGNATNIFTFDNDNNLVAGYPDGAGFNRNSVRRISVPVQRYLATGIFKYELTDTIQAFSEITFAKVKSSSSIEATPLDSGDVTNYSIDNPFVPQDIRNAILAANSDSDVNNDVTGISFRRRQNEVFTRSNTNDRETWRIATGLRGKLSDTWNWDVAYVYGRLRDYTASEDIDALKYAQALDAVVDGNGNIVCRSEAARAAGCAPINLFGFGTASPEASAYVKAALPRSNTVTNTQQVYSANLSGTVPGFSAGDIGLAIGTEYRKEKSVSDWDDLTNLGQNSGNMAPDTVGKYDVWDIYGEVNVPLLRDVRFAQELNLTGAVRYSDYSTIGGVVSWESGAEWVPVDGVRIRGKYAQANRAPNIDELFTAASETFPSTRDVCSGTTATSTGEFADACRAIPAIGAIVANGGTFTQTTADQQGVNGFNGGNINLKEETAKTITAGVVLTPSAIRNFTFSADYFNIKVEDAIGLVARSTSVEECLRTGQSQFCNNVIRDGNTGQLVTVNSQLMNIANFKTSGIDFAARYKTGVGLAEGDALALSALYTWTLTYKKQDDPSAAINSGVGNMKYGQVFEHKVSATAVYAVDNISFSWTTNYMSAMKDSPDAYDANGIPADIWAHNNIGDRFYHDIQLRADFEDKKFGLYAGVDNLFNSKPPVLEDGAFYSTVTGTTTAADVYDVYGRRFYVGANIKF